MARHRAARTRRLRGGGAAGLLASALAGATAIAGPTVVGASGLSRPDLPPQALRAPTTPDPAASAAHAVSADPPSTEPSPPDAAGALPLVAGIVDVDATVATEAGRRAEQLRLDPATSEQAAPSVTDQTARPATEPARCSAGRDGFGPVANPVAVAGEELRCRFSVDTVYGIAGRSGSSDHPKGKALDFMVERATGDQLAQFATENLQRLGIKYLIYRQRINVGQGWEPMQDRGGATANHMDHVHISFD